VIHAACFSQLWGLEGSTVGAHTVTAARACLGEAGT
jgi:hypothetical protein